MGNFGERCSSCNFDGKFPRGRESRKLGAQKKCVYAALCSSVLADGMGNGRIAWDPRGRRDAQKQASVIWDFDLLELLQDLDISLLD